MIDLTICVFGGDDLVPRPYPEVAFRIRHGEPFTGIVEMFPEDDVLLFRNNGYYNELLNVPIAELDFLEDGYEYIMYGPNDERISLIITETDSLSDPGYIVKCEGESVTFRKTSDMNYLMLRNEPFNMGEEPWGTPFTITFNPTVNGKVGKTYEGSICGGKMKPYLMSKGERWQLIK